MARPLVSDVYKAIQAHAGDPAGQYVTNALAQPYYLFAYGELFRASQKYQNTRIQAESYYDLPAYNSVLDPATAGINDMEEPLLLEERGTVTEVGITAAVIRGSALQITTGAPHGFSTGDQIVQFLLGGLSDDANGIFTITVTGASAYNANGCTASGTYTSGGTAAKSLEGWTEVKARPTLTQPGMAPQTILGYYDWKRELFHFPPCSALRQIKFTYIVSGDGPTSPIATVPINDSRDFLAFRAAGLLLQARGNKDKAAALNLMAVGPKWANGEGEAGGILGQLMDPSIREMQRLPPWQRRSPAFRAHRRRVVF